jgi:hypothetical protein
MAEIDISKATAEPDELQFATPTVIEQPDLFIKRVVPEQLWSVLQAINFIMHQENDLRDPNNWADIVAATLSNIVDRSVTDSDLETLYVESGERRSEIDLESITEETYKKQRDPRLLRDFILEVLIAGGLEEELAEDLVETLSDDEIVELTDQVVKDATESGTAPAQKTRAEEIALKLGLDIQTDMITNQNLIIEEPFETDSTDPYFEETIK